MNVHDMNARKIKMLNSIYENRVRIGFLRRRIGVALIKGKVVEVFGH